MRPLTCMSVDVWGKIFVLFLNFGNRNVNLDFTVCSRILYFILYAIDSDLQNLPQYMTKYWLRNLDHRF